MASEAATPSSFIQNLINLRNRDISLFLPFVLGLNVAEYPGSSPDRIVLINPFTQGMIVIERSSGSDGDSSLGFESMLNELLSRKSGRPPASKAAIDALESVEIAGSEGNGDQCAICLEEWETAGEKAKRMPCEHKFHGECIEKWLSIHGSCPVCRYEMPVDETDDEKKGRRGVWVSVAFSSASDIGVSSERRREESDEDVSQ